MEIASFLRLLISYIFVGFIFLYLPGEAIVAITKRSFTGWMRVVTALWIGISVFICISYAASLLHVRWVVLPIIIIIASIGGIYFCKNWKFICKDWAGPHWFLIPLVLLFSFSVVSSGWFTNGGLELRGVNSVDGIWNLALIEELVHSFPPEHPAIAGVLLKGYHLLYNLLVADFARLSGLPTISLHFHFFPVVMSFLLVYGIYALALKLTGFRRHSIWATFFALAGGSFAFVLPVFFGRSASLDDAFGITQPFSLLVSPSFALSLLSIIYTWLFLDAYDKRPSWIFGALIGVFAGLAVGMKVYAGMILLPIIGWFVLLRLVTRRDWASIVIVVVAGVVAAGTFLPLNASYGFLRYQPLWPPHRVMQGVLDFTQWELKRQTLEQMRATRGLVKLEIVALVIFIFGNLGTRFVGLIGLLRMKQKKVSVIVSFLIIGSLVSFTLPMFFLQPIGAFNMIQFFWYFLVFMGILAGWGWSLLLDKATPLWRVILSIIMIVATIPSATEKFVSFTERSTALSHDEIAFYRVLRRVGNPGDTVLVMPVVDGYSEEHIRGWVYRTGPTMPALSGKRTFLGNEVVQFPYDEWVNPRIALLNAFLLGFNSRLSEEEKRAESRKALQTLQEKYSMDFIVAPKGAQPWFVSEPWLRFLYTNTYGTLYQVHDLQ
ncbi:MAG: hypothetical protein AAB557_00510 [Patescibacteria group bacterium]